MTTQTLKGFRDFLPPDAAARQWLKNRMTEVFARWGYEPLETPTLEPLELFQGEIGEDEKLFFKFKDLGGRDVALRYDQTLPTCRVVGQYYGQITFPWRRYQIQSAFRAEKPQAGRYREFTQADIDIFGVASPPADAETIAIPLDVCRSLGFKEAIAVVNNRDLMADIPYPAIASIDKLAKIGQEGVIQDMVSKGISADDAREFLSKVKSIRPDETINTIFSYLQKYGFAPQWYRFEPTLARSFSYSQGPIWEIVIPGFASGSIGGGERYDGLVKRVTGKDIPATGFAFGFDRVLEAARQFDLVPPVSSPVKVLVTVFSAELFDKSVVLSSFLRQKEIPAQIYPDPGVRLDKQLKYAAARGIPYVAILGPEELSQNQVKIKNMSTGEQSLISQNEIQSLLS